MMSGLTRRILGVPLVAKLIGANVIIVASAFVLQASAVSSLGRAEIVTAVAALALASVVNFLLVRLALKPVRELETLALRVTEGEFDARGVSSPYADKDLARLSDTVNSLLDSLAEERRRIQDLGADVVRAHDVERASVSRELHDSIAQTLAAVRYQLAAAGREEESSEIRNSLAAANAMISTAMDEIVTMSNSLHSRVAEDLGLEAALGTLARHVESTSGAAVEVIVSSQAKRLPPAVSATLFRVAEEALRELEMHRGGKSATVSVDAGEGHVRLEVFYDGHEPARAGLSLMKDRVMLAGGVMTIENQNGGTRVTAELKRMKAAS
ncbi:MAG TPA: histidine kinase [Gemmatimonadaceae bacterium]|nr:histidine kinase [Gemmatimonadaceae bacterium]